MTTHCDIPVISSTLLGHREAVDHVLEMDRTADLGEDREGVRIPFEKHVVFTNRGAVLKENAGAVYHFVAFALTALFVDEGEDTGAVHGHQFALGVADRIDAEEFRKAV